MKPKIYFHVGFHKTGTTYLQENIFANLNGIIFLGKSSGTSTERSCRFIEYITSCSDLDFDPSVAYLIFSKMLEEKGYSDLNSQKILISDEALSGGFDWFGGQAGFVAERIKNIFTEYDVKIIIGIRDQVSAICSFYSEYLKLGGTVNIERLLFSEFSHGKYLIGKLAYSNFIDKYQQIYEKSNVYVYLFEDFTKNDLKTINLILDFIGVDKLLMVNKAEINKSLSVVGMFLIKIVNLFFFTRFNNSKHFLTLNGVVGYICFKLIHSKYYWIFNKRLVRLRIIDKYLVEDLAVNEVTKILHGIIFAIDSFLFRSSFFKFRLSNGMINKIQDIYFEENEKILRYLSDK